MRKLQLILVLTCVAAVLPRLAGASVLVPWLYEVEVPVADQTPAARLDASREALLQVLVRVTGLADLPRTEPVIEALKAPDLYYNQFGFVASDRPRATGAERDSLALKFQFDSASLLRLIKRAQLPVWPAHRPAIVAWVVIDQGFEAGGEREIVGAAAAAAGITAMAAAQNDLNDPQSEPQIDAGPAALVGAAIETQARTRGLPLVLPLLDLADQMAVEPAGVWGRLSQVLQPASERYGPDIVLVGRVQPDQKGWVSHWEFWLDGQVLTYEGAASGLQEQTAGAVDHLADELMQRYAVPGRDAQQVSVAVSGIQGPDDYGQLLNYLSALEFVEDVAITEVQDDQLAMELITRATPEKLLALFQADGRLFVDDLQLVRFADLHLVWRRR